MVDVDTKASPRAASGGPRGDGIGGSGGGQGDGGRGARGEPSDGAGRGAAAARGRTGGFFDRYKPDQGARTRNGTVIGVGVLIVWGVYFLYDQLAVFEGGDPLSMAISKGIPLLVGVVLGAVAWWIVYVHRKTGDFMVATEGEMKKVSWSTRREVIGSTKVVIAFTLFLALLLFFVDIVFQFVFTALGVLKK